MTYNFKKFDQKNVRSEGRITLTKSYSFGFPTKFFEDNNISDYTGVVLYWDASSNAVGLRFTKEGQDTAAFKIIKSGQGYGAQINPRAFFKVNNIDPRKYSGRYEWRKENIEGEGEMFVIQLREGNVVGETALA